MYLLFLEIKYGMSMYPEPGTRSITSGSIKIDYIINTTATIDCRSPLNSMDMHVFAIKFANKMINVPEIRCVSLLQQSCYSVEPFSLSMKGWAYAMSRVITGHQAAIDMTSRYPFIWE